MEEKGEGATSLFEYVRTYQICYPIGQISDMDLPPVITMFGRPSLAGYVVFLPGNDFSTLSVARLPSSAQHERLTERCVQHVQG